MNNDYAIRLYKTENNMIYHNNFINNTASFYMSGYANTWDDGIEGNYWSHSMEILIDFNNDGIRDVPVAFDGGNIDYHPLMGMFRSFEISSGYHVNVISNSTIDYFEYFESNSTIKMRVSNMTNNQTHGFCRVCIPKDLIAPNYTVTIDDGLTEVLNFDGVVHDNGTHRWIYFAYAHLRHEVVIVPEISGMPILLLLMISTPLLVMLRKRKLI